MAELRLIDANALIRDVMGLTIVSPEAMNYANAVAVAIANAPTIDAEPVVHAYWMDGIICSRCRSTKARPWAAYLEQRANTFCHVCGAKMDGGANDE